MLPQDMFSGALQVVCTCVRDQEGQEEFLAVDVYVPCPHQTSHWNVEWGEEHDVDSFAQEVYVIIALYHVFTALTMLDLLRYQQQRVQLPP